MLDKMQAHFKIKKCNCLFGWVCDMYTKKIKNLLNNWWEK